VHKNQNFCPFPPLFHIRRVLLEYYLPRFCTDRKDKDLVRAFLDSSHEMMAETLILPAPEDAHENAIVHISNVHEMSHHDIGMMCKRLGCHATEHGAGDGGVWSKITFSRAGQPHWIKVKTFFRFMKKFGVKCKELHVECEDWCG